VNLIDRFFFCGYTIDKVSTYEDNSQHAQEEHSGDNYYHNQYEDNLLLQIDIRYDVSRRHLISLPNRKTQQHLLHPVSWLESRSLAKAHKKNNEPPHLQSKSELIYLELVFPSSMVLGKLDMS
jgi:hypothetical protein